MQIPLELTLHDIPHSDAVEARIRSKAEKLERFHDRIMSCRVAVESPQRHRHQGKLYSVHIDIRVPGGGELAVTRVQDEDVFVAIRDAFNAATRQLQDYSSRQRGDVKLHDVPHYGRVSKLFPAQGYGFIATPDMREVYFNQSCVGNPGFENLEIGMDVNYVEEEGKDGPQARMVTVGKHSPMLES
jgi:ribosomal subunit interface protein